MKHIPLTDIATVIRSKNAGPFELTLDVIFRDESEYRWVKEMNFFTKDRIAHVYDIHPDTILKIIYFDPARGVKITFLRPVPSGSPGDSDVYGAQQHAPLLSMMIPMREE